MEIAFSVKGRNFRLTPEEVIEKLKVVSPEPTRTLVVQVEGKTYPVKQAFTEVTGLDRADFISHQARNVFQRLGFEVNRI